MHNPAAILCLAAVLSGCATTRVRDFAADYQPVWSASTTQYPNFSVYDLPAQNRLMVRLGLVSAMASALNAGFTLGFGGGTPSQAEHEAAAAAFLAESGRGPCRINDASIEPKGASYEFRYACESPAAAVKRR